MFSDKWHKRFMEVAELVSTWSKDPSTKVGAIVVGPDREIRSTGYNGLVRGVDEMVVTYKPEFDENAPQNTWRDKLVFSEEMFKEAGIEYLLLPPKK